MTFEHADGTPFDYSDNKVSVYFEVADKQGVQKIMENISFIHNIDVKEHGLEVKISIQQIPEVIHFLSKQNIAIYAVIPEK